MVELDAHGWHTYCNVSLHIQQFIKEHKLVYDIWKTDPLLSPKLWSCGSCLYCLRQNIMAKFLAIINVSTLPYHSTFIVVHLNPFQINPYGGWYWHHSQTGIAFPLLHFWYFHLAKDFTTFSLQNQFCPHIF